MATLLYTMGSTSGALTAYHFLPKSILPLSSPPLTSRVHIISSRNSSHVAHARRSGLSSRTRRLEKKRGNKGGVTTTEEEEEDLTEEFAASSSSVDIGGEGGEMEYSSEPMPKLEGLEPNFWEGSKWDALGFFVQYMWAFGVLFGLVACGIAVATYNEGATDFKKTPVYKESIQSRELLEEPETSNADVFEANPTETAPSLE